MIGRRGRRHERPRDLGERADRFQEQVDEELRTHLELRKRELIEAGLSPEEADVAARARFGSWEDTVDECVRSDHRREARMATRELWLGLVKDSRIGFRQLTRRPAFALVAVFTLAIGIGANTAIFSAVDHVLLRPLPYDEHGRVLTVWERDHTTGVERREVSPGNFNEWLARAGSFAEMGLAEPFGGSLTGVRPAEAVQSWAVTEGWFDALGVQPALGRTFTAEEHAAGHLSAVVISHEWWVTRYGGDPGVLGRTIELDDTAVPIVGVLPRGLDYPPPKPFWSPKTWYSGTDYDERLDRNSPYMLAVARLRGGFTPADAGAEMQQISAELAGAYPRTNAGIDVTLVPLAEHIVGEVRPVLFVLLGTVGFVLLIACANVMSLLLARAAERTRELRVRHALGAGRRRLLLQLLTESAVLAFVGGVAGLGVAWLGLKWFVAAAPPELPRTDAIALDGRILAFSAAVTLLTALLFGMVPALRSSGRDLTPGSGSRITTGRRISLVHRALVVSQVALALVLLVGAGLLGRSFFVLTDNDVGFRREGRAAIQLFLWDRYPQPEDRVNAVARLEEEMRAVPGVTEVALTSSLPFHPEQIDAQAVVQIEGRPSSPGDRPSAYTFVATPDYFEVMGIPIVRGRGFTDEDRLESPRVVVVNETLADWFFPGEDPVGRRLTIGVMDQAVAREIVGVVGDVRATGFDANPHPEAYVPFSQQRGGSVTLVAAVDGSTAAALPGLREAVARFDADQPIYHAHTMEELVRTELAERRFTMLVLASLAAVALALAAAGIYGVLSYTTGLRASEIGVRMAMGAHRGDVVRMILAQGLTLTVIGVAIGVVAAAALTRFMTTLLYGVEPLDPLTFGPVALLMVAIAAIACWLPARRASRYHPAAVLHE